MSLEYSPLVSRTDPWMRVAVGVSAGAHLAVLVTALVIQKRNEVPLIRFQHEPIVAKIVRLGKPRDERLLPRKFKTPPPQKPQVAIAPSVETQPRTDPAPTPPKDAEPVEDPLAAAISRIADEVDPAADPDDAPPGQLDGDPDGTAADAGEGDRYLALVRRAIHEHYHMPKTINHKERMFLNATVVIYVAVDGRITRREIEKSSNNDQFDSALIRAVDAASPLPPPPEEWRDIYRTLGLGLRFKI